MKKYPKLFLYIFLIVSGSTFIWHFITGIFLEWPQTEADIDPNLFCQFQPLRCKLSEIFAAHLEPWWLWSWGQRDLKIEEDLENTFAKNTLIKYLARTGQNSISEEMFTLLFFLHVLNTVFDRLMQSQYLQNWIYQS